MDVRIEHTILIKRGNLETRQLVRPLSERLIGCLCCIRMKKTRVHTCVERKQKVTNKVRFREPNQVDVENKRHPSWGNYEDWNQETLDVAIDDFIQQTLISVVHSMVADDKTKPTNTCSSYISEKVPTI